MKKLVLCFDESRGYPEPETATNVYRLCHLLGDGPDQLTWHHPGVSANVGTMLRLGRAAADGIRGAIGEAYEFLADRWEPGDPIYLFGAGRGGYCAQALTRLLATVGLLPDLADFVLDAYALPRTGRTEQDWIRVRQIASQLDQQREIPVRVAFLGLWDSLRAPGFVRRAVPAPMSNVESGRHAVAIDGRPGERSLASERIEEVWFRGAHCDVAGGQGACEQLARISFDWILAGAIGAGLTISDESTESLPAAGHHDALAETAHTISVRKVPEAAAVHASIELYLRGHPQYWKRLPARVTWADLDWAARGERLVHVVGATKAVTDASPEPTLDELVSNIAG
ncbi:phospholipase effector Tle1 domain-containing protein [Mycolicibacterium celeriflavum]|uniref:phospholipase effector Tle1 domain-containing protein n=1 Tax=Mycolicibacterium celeriflavum TaxID=1249101 RepID=UPI003CF43890